MRSYINSKNCAIEMDLADKFNKRVIPINLELSHSEWIGGDLECLGKIIDFMVPCCYDTYGSLQLQKKPYTIVRAEE